MKKLIYCLIIFLAFNVQSQIRVVPGGNVGICALAPTDKLQVIGSTRLSGNTVFDNWTDLN